MQAAFTISPNSPPPEIVRQIRAGIFQALASSWEEFMRSPQFLESMKQWMENAITFRKMTTDFMARVRNEMQAPSREDIDTIMLNIRHLEKRLLDRLDELATQVNAMNHPATGNGRARPRARTAARRGAAKTRRAPAQKR
jgi:microsomal dipeptidase-like Zn-dependent dipeptidase